MGKVEYQNDIKETLRHSNGGGRWRGTRAVIGIEYNGRVGNA